MKRKTKYLVLKKQKNIVIQRETQKLTEMIVVKLLCFGITKEMTGAFEKTIELPEESSIKILKEKLELDFPDLKKLNSLRIAVNEEYAEDSLVLNHKDEVVLIPPVSGG